MQAHLGRQRRPGGWAWRAVAAVLAVGLAGCQEFRFPWDQAQRPSGQPQNSARSPSAAATRPAEIIRPPHPSAVWPPRAVWVVRKAYRSPAEIAELMEKCRQAGLNTVLFQVRGNGTAFYRSRYEPLAVEFTGGDPGFDPLEVACREAHRRGLALHAWVNVMPAWRGGQPPADPRQLYNARPEWFLYDQNGRRQPLNPTFYVSLNPCLPEVRQYLVDVFCDIVERYPVDGLHLDYIRFPIEDSPKGSDYPYDRRTLELFRQTAGRSPQEDPALWTRWRTAQVTQLVRQISVATRRIRPGLRLTAAVKHNFQQTRNQYFQDGPIWLRDRLIDLAFVMNYTGDTAEFRTRQEEYMRAAPTGWVAPGISLDIPRGKPTAATMEQLRLAEQWGRGFALFAAEELFGDAPRAQQRWRELQPALLAMQSRRLAEAAPAR